MADILLNRGVSPGINETGSTTEAQLCLDLGREYRCSIYGKKDTFTVIQDGENVIIAIGYVCSIEDSSVQNTLSRILRDFNESQIIELKKKLVGQYLLLVKRGMNIYIFSDFIGVRNVFYSSEGIILSSSFSMLEDALTTKDRDLDTYKFIEYLAMRHVLYPAWLGRSTYHRHIKWLLPYEYMAIDMERAEYRIGSLIYEIDNRKQTDRSLLAAELLSTLSGVMARKEFKQQKVATSLTGGHDSRLISAVAIQEFNNIHFRTSVSQGNPRSQRDLKVASKIAKILNIPHDIYYFRPGQDEKRFVELTEGLSPVYNQTITPLIDSAGAYSLGFGGAFGTELFMPIPCNSVEEYIQEKVTAAKQVLKVEHTFWQDFRESLDEQFRSIRTHFKLSTEDDRDYIRLFSVLDTARYGSFIMSAFNRSGYQIDPFAHYAVLELALRVAPSLWGDHKKFGGAGLVHKSAMDMINPKMGTVMAYMHFRPMLSLSIMTAPRYLLGYAHQLALVLGTRSIKRFKKPKRSDLPGGYYLTDGWQIYYITRTIARYGKPPSSVEERI